MTILDYRGDPRAYLMHEGNENSGRYRRGSGARPFQHTGIVRRKARGSGLNPLDTVAPTKYQNADGSLTAAGEERYRREIQKNRQKKKDNRVDETALKDPKLWEQQDIERTRDIAKASEQLTKDLGRLATPKQKPRGHYDLSETTDEELRQRINRLQMEEQYTRLMDTKSSEVTKGKGFMKDILDSAGDVLAVASSALTIALLVKQVKG